MLPVEHGAGEFVFTQEKVGSRYMIVLFRTFVDANDLADIMAANALQVSPPLGRFRDFVTDLDEKHPGKVDLKTYGARLFIDAARIYAMASGVHNTNTPQRMKLSASRLGMNADETSAMIEAFNFIQLLRLKHQHLEHEQGKPGDNLIEPDKLNELDRRILKEAFKQARKYQQRLKLDYQSH